MHWLLIKNTSFIQWPIQPTLMTCFYINYTSNIWTGHSVCYTLLQVTQTAHLIHKLRTISAYKCIYCIFRLFASHHLLSHNWLAVYTYCSYVHLTVYKHMYITYNLAYKCLFRILLHLEGSGIYSIRDFSYLGERTASFLWLEGR